MLSSIYYFNISKYRIQQYFKCGSTFYVDMLKQYIQNVELIHLECWNLKKSKTYNHMGSQIVRKILIEMMVQTESKLNAPFKRKNNLKFEIQTLVSQ